MGTENKIGAGKVIGGIVTTITLVSALTGIAINVFDIKDRLSNNGSDKNQAAIGNDFGNSENIINPSLNEKETDVSEDNVETSMQEIATEIINPTVKEEETTIKENTEEINLKFVPAYDSAKIIDSVVMTNNGTIFMIERNAVVNVITTNTQKSIKLSDIKSKLEDDVHDFDFQLMYNEYDDVVYLWANKYLLEINEELNIKLIYEFDEKDCVGLGYSVFCMLDSKHILTNYYGACIIDIDTWNVENISYTGSEPSPENYYQMFRNINGQLYVMDTNVGNRNRVVLLDESGYETESFTLKYDTGIMLKELPISNMGQICHTDEGAYCFCDGKIYLFDGKNEVVRYIGTHNITREDLYRFYRFGNGFLACSNSSEVWFVK